MTKYQWLVDIAEWLPIERKNLYEWLISEGHTKVFAIEYVGKYMVTAFGYSVFKSYDANIDDLIRQLMYDNRGYNSLDSK